MLSKICGIVLLVVFSVLLVLACYSWNLETKPTNTYPNDAPCNCDSLNRKVKNSLVYYTPYKNGKKNGVERAYSDDGFNCILQLEITYVDNIKQNEKYYTAGWAGLVLTRYVPSTNGIETKYSCNGALEFEVEITNGKRNGIGKWYYESGKVSGTAEYKNGEMIGYKKCTNGKLGNESLVCE